MGLNLPVRSDIVKSDIFDFAQMSEFANGRGGIGHDAHQTAGVDATFTFGPGLGGNRDFFCSGLA
jgi:hypothetical protein